PPPEISPLSLHDALPIYATEPPVDVVLARHEVRADVQPVLDHRDRGLVAGRLDAEDVHAGAPSHDGDACRAIRSSRSWYSAPLRSEEHTSELQSQSNLVC